MTQPEAETRDVVSFGPFALVASERLLTREGTALELGARALDILIALVSHPNQAIGKRDLMAQVWPDVTVGEGSLRFHMASLRKALGDGQNGARYIATLTGRGYCFVAPVSRSSDRGRAPGPASVPPSSIPGRLARMVGRADAILMVSTQLTTTRFVTIVGAGGVGKTTVAVAVGHDLMKAFVGTVCFVDLGALSDPKLVAASLASTLGLAVRSDDPTPELIAYLRDKRIVLIFDNCEHLIDTVASLAARIFVAAPKACILATSREPLRVEGEHVYRLAPLAFPPDEPELTAEEALTFPAIQLFMERVAAGGGRLDLSGSNAAIAADICRKLDGIPLAIELTAGRVEAFGLQQTAALLEERLSLLWLGQRSAPRRQHTLKATLDWSYGLLSMAERHVLRQLAVFVGNIPLEAARVVLTGAATDQAGVLGAIDSLVAKSMVATNGSGTMMRYRLLDTTRAYVLEIEMDDTELADLAARHATYYRQWLEKTGAEWPNFLSAAERAPYLGSLGNLRTALEWAFGAYGDAQIGIELAAAAAPFFLAMSLLAECLRWSERAIVALDDATRGGPEEMHLQAALGMSLMFMRGMSEAARAALTRGLTIAEERGDALSQQQLLVPLFMFHFRIRDLKTSLHYAKRCSTIAETIEDPAGMALAHTLQGNQLLFVGDFRNARVELEAALRHGPGPRRTNSIYFGFDHYSWANGALANTLWMLGYPVQAVERARQTVKDAAATGDPVTLTGALNYSISVYLWTGDLQSAEEDTDWLITHAELHSLGPYHTAGHGYRGTLAISRGDANGGVESLQKCLEELHAAGYELATTPFTTPLVLGLAALGRFAEGIALIDETLRLVEADGDTSFLPEVLRVKGCLLLSMPEPRNEDAESCFMRSMDLSRRQGALAWELRTVVDLGALWTARGRPEAARSLLRPVYDRFTEGFETADLKAAERLLATLD